MAIEATRLVKGAQWWQQGDCTVASKERVVRSDIRSTTPAISIGIGADHVISPCGEEGEVERRKKRLEW